MKPLTLFLSLLAVASLACMQQVQQINVAPTAPTATSANPQTAVEPVNLPKSELENAPNPTPATVYVTAAETVYIRSNHSHLSDIVRYLMKGETITVYECFGVWARIGAGRWVNSYFLSELCK